MDKFLERKDQETFNILLEINIYENKDISVDMLAENMGVSVAKVSKLMGDLLDEEFLISKPFINQLSFEKKGNGKIIKGNNFSLGFFLKKFMKRSIFYHWLEDLFSDRDISLEKYAQEWYVSKSSISRKWRYLKEILSEYDLEIDKRNNIFTLSGEEEKIRFFYYQLFKVTNKDMKQHFSDSTIFDKKMIGLNDNISQIAIDGFERMVCISSLRAKKGNVIEQDPDYFYVHGRLFEPNQLEQLCGQYYKKFAINSQTEEKEFAFLHFFMETGTTVTGETILEEGAYLSPRFIEDYRFKDCNNLIYKLVNELNLILEATDYFYLIANLYVLTRKQEVYGKLSDLAVGFVNNRQIEAFTSKLSPTFNSYMSINKLHLLFYPFILKVNQHITIMVISSFGDSNRIIIENKIKENVNFPVVFVSRLQDKPEIIVSDNYYIHEEIPCVYVKPIPSALDMYNMVEIINRMITDKYK